MLAATDDVPLPADWPALWAAILRVGSRIADGERRPADAGADPAAGTLGCGIDGWSLQGEWSRASATLFGFYKPLLDARTALTADPRHSPWLVAQLGLSLDGCVATRSGESQFVTGPGSLVHLHRLRALSDAVLVGAGTVAADDPQLTTRRVPGPQPVRVVLDPSARLDGRARVLRDGQAPTLWLCDTRHRESARVRLAAEAADARGAEVVGIDGLLAPSARGGFDPKAVVSALAARGLRLLFIEGGGVTVSRFLAVGSLDRLHLIFAPLLIGGGRPGLHLPAREALRDCPRLPARVLPLGDDMLWDLDLRAAQPPLQPLC